MSEDAVPASLDIHPLTPDRWDDLVALFGERGAVAGCWCMWWRQTSAEFSARAGEQNRESFRALVDSGDPPGLLAYRDGTPVGWCAVARREEFGRLNRSPVLKPVDAQSAWSIVCFYMNPHHRGHGVGAALLGAALQFAVACGARIVEGYPVDVGTGRASSGAAFTGVVGMFRAAGFEEVARRSPGRPVMRYFAR